MSRRILTILTIIGVTFGLAACTPRPDVADSAAEEFLLRLREHVGAHAMTDNPEVSEAAINTAWDKLQAESLDAELLDVYTKDNAATAKYHLNWHLPGNREFGYDTQMKLTKSGSEWYVRWQPTVLHPDLGANQHLELRPVIAETASVVGSDGAVLMRPGKQWRIFLTASETDDVAFTVEKIAEALQKESAKRDGVPKIDAEKVTREAKEFHGDYSVATVDERTGNALKSQLGQLAGVRLNEEAALVRPDPNFAPDILSRVNTIVSDDLQGTNGWKIIAATSEGNEVRELEHHDAKASPSVRVGLSRRVQEVAQAAVNTRANDKAMMVVIRPSTGDVLAVAQTPEADKDGDVALQGQYPPGSTFKIITAYAGLQRQKLSPESIVGCPGTQDIGGRIVTNYNGFGLGSVSLRQAFAQSCNTTFADISTQLKPGELKEVGNMFGLGVDFKILGLDTYTGQIPEGDVMLDRTEAGYGQGLDLVSPFGMAMVSATVAKGKMPTPKLISSSGVQTETRRDEHKKLDPKLVAQLQDMMGAVVNGGTAAGLSKFGDVRGKTGEAEINDGSHAWFTGYRDDLAFATLIVRGGGSEHSVAITSEFLKRLDAPRS